MRPILPLCLASAILLMHSHATAETPAANQVNFSWLRAQGAEACPDREAIAKEIETALRSQVFDSAASRNIEVVVSRTEETWRVAIYERMGKEARFFREITNSSPDCDAIAKASLAIIKILIDSGPTPPPREPCPTCDEKPPCPRCAKPSPWKTSLAVRAAVRYGLVPPTLASDFGLFAGLSHQRWEISAGMSWMPDVLGAHGAKFGINTAWLGGCYHMTQRPKPMVSVCGYGVAGAMRTYLTSYGARFREGGGEHLWGAFALSPRLRQPISWLFFEVGLDIIFPLHQYSFHVDSEPPSQGALYDFSQKRPAGSAFVGVGLSIP